MAAESHGAGSALTCTGYPIAPNNSSFFFSFLLGSPCDPALSDGARQTQGPDRQSTTASRGEFRDCELEEVRVRALFRSSAMLSREYVSNGCALTAALEACFTTRQKQHLHHLTRNLQIGNSETCLESHLCLFPSPMLMIPFSAWRFAPGVRLENPLELI